MVVEVCVNLLKRIFELGGPVLILNEGQPGIAKWLGAECPRRGFHPVEAAAIMGDINEQRRSIGQVGREKMCRAFSVQAMVTRMTQVYEEALAARGLGG